MSESSSTKLSHPGSTAPEEAVVERRTLRDYYIIMRERLWIALPLALIVAIGFGYYQARKTPLYSAVAKMQFEKPDTVVTTQGIVDSSVRSDLDMNTYIQILGSNRLRARVLASFTPDEQKILTRAALKKLAPGQPEPTTPDLGSVTCEPIHGTYLININVSNEDPEAAALVANRYVEQFIQYLLDNVGGKNEDAVIYLRSRVEQLKHAAEEADRQLEQYMQKNNLVSLDKSVDLVTDRLRTVSNALTTAQLQLLEAENNLKQVEDYRRQHRDLLEISYIAQHGSVQSLRTELAQAQQQQDLLAERYLERHPKMIEIAGRIRITQSQLRQAINDAIADLQTNLAAFRSHVANLQSEFEAQEKEELRLKGLAGSYTTLQTNAQVAKNYYMEILDRLNQTTTTKSLEKIPLHVLDRATVPSSPTSPNLPGTVRSSLVLGLVVFFAVAIGLSFIDDRIKSAWDVESFIGVNLLGIIPDLAEVPDENRYTLIASARAESTTGTESFLGLYSAVKINSKLDFPKSMLITSTIPGEGKTLISCNLAGCFARHGKRTLLVDCDMRRPMLHRHFKQQNQLGLINWYENGARLDDDVMTNPHLGITQMSENLYLLTSGGRSKSPTELLESPAFADLLGKLKRAFDLVLVDSPPMGAVTDSLLIAERIDEVVYVCRFNRAFRKHIRLYIRALREGKNEILGIVLNGLSPRRIEYYSNYRYYRSYKKYYGANT
jgi:capsular exopolysaccharide synthesis family protein